jgi:G3E family GTPase
MASALRRIPVTILTGFLGAGKSTLLNRLLKSPDMRDCAVIINEFGEVSIDHLLVESSGDSIVELSDGCLCCTVRGELIDTLAELIDRMQTGRIRPLQRVVIETTGLADPAPVMQSVMGNPVIAQHFGLESVVTLVDAVNGEATLSNHGEAVKQVALADRILLTKTDLAGHDQIDRLRRELFALNPRAVVTVVQDAGTDVLFGHGLYERGNGEADIRRWLGQEGVTHPSGHDHHHDHACGPDCTQDHHHHDSHGSRHSGSIRSFSILHDKPISPTALEMFIDLLRSAHGEKLLRMKAIVNLADNPERPVILHGVQSIFHPPVRLAAWPDPDDRRTRLVLITHDLPEDFVRDLFDAFTGKPQIDRPDRAALEDNPLAVPGMRF